MIQGALFVAVVLHLAWTGALAGVSTFAVAVDALAPSRRRGLAGAIAAAVPGDLFAAAWLEVTAAGILVLARIRHPLFPQAGSYWAGVLAPLVAGLALLGLFRGDLAADARRGLRTAVGLAGIALLVLSSALLCEGSGALLQPEAFATVEPGYRVLLTWSGTFRFAEFTLLALALAGLLVAAAGDRAADPADGRFARRLGYRSALALLLAWPLALLFTHVTLPAIALSPALWALAGLGVALGGAAASLLTSRLSGETAGAFRPPAVLALAILGTVVGGEQLAREWALRPVVLAGLQIPPPAAAAAAPAAPVPPAAGGAVAAGKAVFDRVCHLCHRFDVKLIGPPFDRVVPKYRREPEALRAFIRNPTKKDPAFPAMPRPAVTPAEVDAVAAYLLETAAP